jgi:hypothetical protein
MVVFINFILVVDIHVAIAHMYKPYLHVFNTMIIRCTVLPEP